MTPEDGGEAKPFMVGATIAVALAPRVMVGATFTLALAISLLGGL